MRYLIGIIFAVLSLAFIMVSVKIGILMWEDPSWILVALGVYPSTALSVLITVVSFQAAKDYENLP
jgi:hypothetical protein